MNLWKDIKRKRFSPTYLLYGTEAFLINETTQLLVNHVFDEGEVDFNLSSYDLEDTPIETVIEEAETLPFIGERKLILAHNPDFLTAEKTKGKIEHNLAKLEAYLKQPAPYSILVFLAPYEKLDERKKLTKELKRQAAILEAKKLNEAELKNWIKERAALNEVEIDDQAVELILNLAGTDLFMLTNEVDKLALYCQQEKKIDTIVVEQLVARSLEQNIFSLVDKIVNRKIEQAFRIYYDLLKQNEEPIKILAMITSQFRLLYQVKEMSRRGYGQQHMAGFLKVHPYRIKLAAGQVRDFSDEELKKIMNELAEADYKMKTGAMNKELLIELFLFHLQDEPQKGSHVSSL